MWHSLEGLAELWFRATPPAVRRNCLCGLPLPMHCKIRLMSVVKTSSRMNMLPSECFASVMSFASLLPASRAGLIAVRIQITSVSFAAVTDCMGEGSIAVVLSARLSFPCLLPRDASPAAPAGRTNFQRPGAQTSWVGAVLPSSLELL